MDFAYSNLLRSLSVVSVVLLLNACQPESKHANTQKPAIEQTYNTWLNEGNNAAEVSKYESYLKLHQRQSILKMSDLMSNWRDFERCRVDAWLVPPEILWPNQLKTLDIVQQLQERKILLTSDLVTSSYRDESLNKCAGGSSASKHLGNFALDVQLLGERPEHRYIALCAVWQEKGKALNWGLGFYGDNQIHIDSAGWRTWGTDYSKKSSPCHA